MKDHSGDYSPSAIMNVDLPRSLQLAVALSTGVGVGMLLGALLVSRRRTVIAVNGPSSHTNVRDCMISFAIN